MLLPAILLCVHAFAAGTAPVADAGLGVLAYAGDTVVLNGTGSNDADGEPLSYTWTQLDGARVEFIDAPTAQPSFQIPEPGPYRFSLVVNDGTLDSSADEVSFYAPDREALPEEKTGCATAPAPAGLLVLGIAALSAARRRAIPGG